MFELLKNLSPQDKALGLLYYCLHYHNNEDYRIRYCRQYRELHPNFDFDRQVHQENDGVKTAYGVYHEYLHRARYTPKGVIYPA